MAPNPSKVAETSKLQDTRRLNFVILSSNGFARHGFNSHWIFATSMFTRCKNSELREEKHIFKFSRPCTSKKTARSFKFEEPLNTGSTLYILGRGAVAQSVERPSKFPGHGATLLTEVRTPAAAKELGKILSTPSGDSDLSVRFRNVEKPNFEHP